MAQLVAAVTTSHVPSIGIAMDTGISQDPYWKPLFDGYLPGTSTSPSAAARSGPVQRANPVGAGLSSRTRIRLPVALV
jgi:hypothetical protein